MRSLKNFLFDEVLKYSPCSVNQDLNRSVFDRVFKDVDIGVSEIVDNFFYAVHDRLYEMKEGTCDEQTNQNEFILQIRK